jgi:putative transposase
MPHSLSQVYVHLVLPMQDRIQSLSDRATRQRLHGYMTGIFKNLESPSLQIGGGDDHVHALFRLSRVQPIARIVEEVKKGSSIWMHNRVQDFRWQDGYGAFSVSPENVDKAIHYIENQELRHHEQTFVDEYRRIVERCGGREHAVAIHLIFSTKNRFPFLMDKTLRQLLHERLAKICERAGCPGLGVGGIADHVHILYRLSEEKSLARVALDLKTTTSAWLATHRSMEGFHWQDGYGTFSVSPQDIPGVIRYIENQEEHHRHETSLAEYDRLQRRPSSTP